MKDYLEGFEIFLTAAFPTAIAIIACIARQAFHGWQGTSNFIRELILCIFFSVLTAWALDYFPENLLSSQVRGAIIGATGFSSVTLVNPFLNRLTKIISEWTFNFGPKDK